MATYAQISGLLQVGGSSGLRERVAVATLVAADAIRQEPDNAADASVQQRKRFAQSLFRTQNNSLLDLTRDDDAAIAFNTTFEGIYRAVVIANRSATVTQITGATDTVIQNAVNDAIDLLALSFPDPAVP